MVFLNPDVEKVQAYTAGKPIEEVSRQFGLRVKDIVKLASNENPCGLSLKAARAIIKKVPALNRYPDSNYFYLRKKVCRSLGVGMDQIVFGNGSDELIDVVIKSFSRPYENILSSKMSFLEYAILSKVNSRSFSRVNLKDLRYDLPAIIAGISNKTRVIFIANPNNPTGTYVNEKEVRQFLDKVPSRVLVVFDEAYNEFVDAKDFPNMIRFINRGNVLVLRTFSKSYGLAGARIGFAVGVPRLIEQMNKARQPFNVNCLAAAGAAEAISDVGFLKKTRKLILSEKKFLYSSFEKMGISYVPSVANFILINAKTDSTALFKRLLKRAVIVRSMEEYALKGFIRVSIGTHKENLKLIEALKKEFKKERA